MNAFIRQLYVLFAALLVTMPAMAAEELIGEWLLNQTATAGVYYDTSGYGYNAVVSGAAYDAGQGAFYFDGVATDTDGADYLDIVNAVYPYNFKADFRITLDVKSTAAGWLPLFSRRAGSGWQPGDWYIALADGKLNVQCGWVGGYGPGTKIVNDGMWHSINIWYIASTDTLYCNVDSSVTDDLVVTPFKGATADNSGHIWIGNHANYQYFNGWLKNIRVYRVAKVAYSPTPEINSFGNLTGVQTLSWNSPDAEVTSFDVYLGTDQSLVTNRDASVKVASNTPNASISYNLAGDTTYYWAIDSIYDPNTANSTPEYSLWQGLSGDVWNFVTVGNYAVNLAPANGSELMSVFTDLSWNVDAAADSYNVYIANTAEELDTVSPINYTASGTSIIYEPGTLELHRTYFWKVGVVRGGVEYPSSVRWFRTVGIEYLEDFNSYATATDVRAVWTCPVYQTNALDVSPEFSRYAMVVPFGGTDVTYSRTFVQAIDLTGVPAIAFEFLYKSAAQGTRPTSFNLKLQNASGNVIVEQTVDSDDDFITPEGTDVAGNWHWVYLSLVDAPNINQVKKITITIPGQAVTGDLRIDNIAMRTPYCTDNIPGDVYNDCVIDIRDFAIMAENWLECNRIPASSCFNYWFQATVE